jgi:hypothetical protein
MSMESTVVSVTGNFVIVVSSRIINHKPCSVGCELRTVFHFVLSQPMQNGELVKEEKGLESERGISMHFLHLCLNRISIE